MKSRRVSWRPHVGRLYADLSLVVKRPWLWCVDSPNAPQRRLALLHVTAWDHRSPVSGTGGCESAVVLGLSVIVGPLMLVLGWRHR